MTAAITHLRAILDADLAAFQARNPKATIRETRAFFLAWALKHAKPVRIRTKGEA